MNINYPTAMRLAFLEALGDLCRRSGLPVDPFLSAVRNGRHGRPARLVARSLNTKTGVIRRKRMWSVERVR